MRSNRVKTEGITLRLGANLLDYYREVAKRANLLKLKQNSAGPLLTVQDVMRHRLASLPGFKIQEMCNSDNQMDRNNDS